MSADTLDSKDIANIITTSSISQSSLQKGHLIGNYKLVQRIPLDYANTVITKWQSQSTGLRVVHIDREDAIIKGSFAVGTEIFNDSGCPHTLEHLIFEGSTQHPDNALTKAVSLGLCSQTNAYTEIDRTVYTVSSANEGDFLNVLPVFVDYILYPSLTEDAFRTEVYQEDESGCAHGVVYCEMQKYESYSSTIRSLAYQRAFYPDGNAYRSETGGFTNALRTLKLQQLKDFHAKYYVPHNLCLIVSGKLSTETLLQQIQITIEARALEQGFDQGPRPESWRRPFMDTESSVVPVLDADVSIKIEDPQKDTFGDILIVMVGPGSEDYTTIEALQILDRYLSKEVFTINNEPWFGTMSKDCCSSISLTTTRRAKFTEIQLCMTNVMLKYIDRAEVILRKAFARVIRHGLKIEYLHDIIHQRELQNNMELEEEGGEIFIEPVLIDFSYGSETENTLQKGLRWDIINSELLSWTRNQWVDIIDRWLIKPKMLVVRIHPSATPSSGEAVKEKQSEELSASFLKDTAEEELKQSSHEAKNKHIHHGSKIQLSSKDKIRWTSVQSASTVQDSDELDGGDKDSKALASHLEEDRCVLPYALHFDHADSQFINISVYMSLADIPADMKHYIYMLRCVFFSARVRLEDGTRIKSSKLTHFLNQDFVHYSFDYCEEYPEVLCLTVKTKFSMYTLAVRWIRRILWSGTYSSSTLKRQIAWIKQEASESLHSSSTMKFDAMIRELRTSDYSKKSSHIHQKIEWIPKLERELKEDSEHVVKTVNSLKSILIRPSNLRFTVYGNVISLPRPRSSWLDNFMVLQPAVPSSIPNESDSLSDLGRQPARKAFIISLPTETSTESIHHSYMTGYSRSEGAAVTTALYVLYTDPLCFWERIRGPGLAYSFDINVDHDISCLSFDVERSPDAFKAYLAAKAVVEDLASGKMSLNSHQIDSAKKRCAYAGLSYYSVPTAASVRRVVGGHQDFSFEKNMDDINAVTVDEVLIAIRKYFVPLFNPQASAAFVVCGPNQATQLVKEFEEGGFEVDFREMSNEVVWKEDDSDPQVKKHKWLDRLRSSLPRQIPIGRRPLSTDSTA